jgi:FkbM family methyltransferase
MPLTDPIVVLDVGARGGAHSRWLPFSSAVQIVGIDADADECARLNARPHKVPSRFLPVALGRTDGQNATLYVTKQPGCSSLLEPNAAFLEPFPYRWAFEVVRRVPVVLTSLDTVCAVEKLRPTVVKLDTQGSELDILHGGLEALRSVCLVETEVEFNPLYRNQPLFGDVDAFLRTQGFALLGLRRDYFRRSKEGTSAAGGTIVHGDALFYRVEIAENQAAHFALALSAYRQADFVQTLPTSTVTPQPHRSLFQTLTGKALSVWPHRQSRAWLDRSRPPGALDWHDPDFF